MPRRPSFGAIALAASATGVHLALGLAMRAPVLHPEELANLGAARYTAGQGLAPQAASSAAYSAVMAPLARFASGGLELWRGALVVNAALAGLTVLLVAALARRLAPDMTEPRRLVLVAAVAAYPALALWSNLAIADNVVVPAFLAVVLLVWRALERDRPAAWLLAGAGAGVAAGAHPRAVVVPLALVAVALLDRPPVRWRPGRAAAALAGAVPLLAAGWALEAYASRGVSAGARVEHVLAAVAADRVADLPTLVAGQIWYLTVATWGLFPLGMAAALAALVSLARGRPAGDDRAVRAVLSFVGLSVAGVLVVGPLYVGPEDRIDALVPGRPVEGFIAPVVLTGLVGLSRLAAAWRAEGRRWTEVARPLGIVAGTLVVAGSGVAIGGGAVEIDLPVVRANVLGLDGLLTWRGMVLSVSLFSVAALAGAAAIIGAGRRLPVAAAAVAGLLFVPSVVTGQDALVEGSRQRSTERAVAEAVLAIDQRLGGVPGNCVGYDLAGLSEWHRANYELFLDDVRLRSFASRRGQQPCSALAVSGRSDFARAFPGSRRVMLENDYSQTLWALPGPVRDRLDRAGWLLPDRLPAPVPPADRRYRISLTDPGSADGALAMRRGAREEVEVTVTHAGSMGPWPSTHGLQSEFQAVRVGVRWYRLGRPGLPDGHPTLDRTRVELPRTLFPGEQATVRVPLEARAKDGTPAPPGTYEARVQVVQNGVAWFEPVGPPLVVEVVVVGRVF